MAAFITAVFAALYSTRKRLYETNALEILANGLTQSLDMHGHQGKTENLPGFSNPGLQVYNS